MKKIKEVKHRWLVVVMACFISLGAISIVGCAARTKTSSVTTQQTQTVNGASDTGTTTSVTTKKEVATDSHPRGIIGGIFYTIGQIIIWPFKVIGSLFS